MDRDYSPAIDVVRNVKAVGTRFAEAADQYLSMMERNDQPEITCGEFYRTYDGSTVYLARRRTACNCPICTGKAVKVFGMIVQQEDTNDDEAHKDIENEPAVYVVVVLRGGHGVANTPGDGPGSPYLVDENGWSLLGKLDANVKNMATQAQLGVSGLSLRNKLKSTFEIME